MTLWAFFLVCLGMVLTPGPNMAYLVSRSISQGRQAAFISLAGVGTGFIIYLVLTALGVTALLMAVPLAYDTIRLAGAAYLLWLAWQVIRPGGKSPFEVTALKQDGVRKLFLMGLATNLLNPKIAILYLSLLPQFIDRSGGNILGQLLGLGLIQVAVSLSVNAAIIVFSATFSNLLLQRPGIAAAQRWLMGTVLGAFALRMALEQRR